MSATRSRRGGGLWLRGRATLHPQVVVVDATATGGTRDAKDRHILSTGICVAALLQAICRGPAALGVTKGPSDTAFILRRSAGASSRQKQCLR